MLFIEALIVKGRLYKRTREAVDTIDMLRQMMQTAVRRGALGVGVPTLELYNKLNEIKFCQTSIHLDRSGTITNDIDKPSGYTGGRLGEGDLA
jgi:hypothetical protein